MAVTSIPKSLLDIIVENAEEVVIDANTEILRKGQYVKVIPIVLDGLIKVYTEYNEKELLLYYIKPNESCTMSFSAGIKNETSSVFAITEQKTRMLLIPIRVINTLIKNKPEFNQLFFEFFNLRYKELLSTINHLIYDKLDKRIYDFLKKRSELTGENPLKISHQQIATELGTSREVVSRIIKKLESEQKVIQQNLLVKIL